MENRNLLQIIKQIAKDERQNSRPCDVMIGTVAKTNPLKISISNKVTIDKDFFTMTLRASQLIYSKGDKVAMIQAQGGQNFVIIDKVV